MDGYEELAETVILQAVKDYRKALKYNDLGVRREVESFFKSEYFRILTDVDGEMLIHKLNLEVQSI